MGKTGMLGYTVNNLIYIPYTYRDSKSGGSGDGAFHGGGVVSISVIVKGELDITVLLSFF